MRTFQVDDTQIQVLPDASAGQQIIRIQATALGAHLVRTLGETPLEPEEGHYTLEHTPELDERLCSLIDCLIGLRYSHPQLLQLRLLPQEVLR